MSKSDTKWVVWGLESSAREIPAIVVADECDDAARAMRFTRRGKEVAVFHKRVHVERLEDANRRIREDIVHAHEAGASIRLLSALFEQVQVRLAVLEGDLGCSMPAEVRHE